jgi:hypothetical protein
MQCNEASRRATLHSPAEHNKLCPRLQALPFYVADGYVNLQHAAAAPYSNADAAGRIAPPRDQSGASSLGALPPRDHEI